MGHKNRKGRNYRVWGPTVEPTGWESETTSQANERRLSAVEIHIKELAERVNDLWLKLSPSQTDEN